MGIDVGGTTISAGIVDERGRVLHRLTCPTYAHRMRAVDNILCVAKQLVARSRVLAAGVGVPGPVDASRGRIIGDVLNIPDLTGVPLRSILRRKLGVPVFVDNDVNALALAESRWGAAKKKRDFVLIMLGTGVGGAIVLDRKLRRGAHGHAGELGHATVNLDGRDCFCGSVGCLKAYAAGPDMVQQFGDRSLTPREIVTLARRGNRKAQTVIATAARALGAACANVTNTLDPELIIIGGSVAEAGEILLKPAREWMSRYALPGVRMQVPIVRSALRKSNAFLGAAALAWESVSTTL